MYCLEEDNLNVLRDDGMRWKKKTPVWLFPSLPFLSSIPFHSHTTDSGSRECSQSNAWSVSRGIQLIADRIHSSH